MSRLGRARERAASSAVNRSSSALFTVSTTTWVERSISMFARQPRPLPSTTVTPRVSGISQT
ncbi:MAG: hypothetical protein OXH79_11250 [Boseongicola sp.]|nr:hypothetical protein [Boseongicola sp.]